MKAVLNTEVIIPILETNTEIKLEAGTLIYVDPRLSIGSTDVVSFDISPSEYNCIN